MKKMYVALDEENRWLAYGEFDGPKAALAEAKKAEDYDPTLDIMVYEIVAGFEFRAGEEEPAGEWRVKPK